MYDDNREFDREFYGAEETGVYDESKDPFVGNPEKVTKFEEEVSRRKKMDPKFSQMTQDSSR